jgi:hypothetical protein
MEGRYIKKVPAEPFPAIILKGAFVILFNGLSYEVPVVPVSPFTGSKTDNGKILGEVLVQAQVIEGGQELPLAQITGAAEYNHRKWLYIKLFREYLTNR